MSKKLTSLFPQDFKDASIKRKGERALCDDHIAVYISLLSIAGKVLAGIILSRSGRSICDIVFAVRQLQEKYQGFLSGDRPTSQGFQHGKTRRTVEHTGKVRQNKIITMILPFMRACKKKFRIRPMLCWLEFRRMELPIRNIPRKERC